MNSILPVILAGAMALVAVVIVAWPLLKRDKTGISEKEGLGSIRAEQLRIARLRIYRRIADLEEDRKSGLLSEDDWQTQLKVLKVAAAKILLAEDTIVKTTDERTELEREILKARKVKPSKSDNFGDEPEKAEVPTTSDKELTNRGH